MTRKNKCLWLAASLLLVALTGCSSSASVDSKQVKAFEQSIESAHHQIEKLKVEMSPSSIGFNYEMNKTDDQPEVDAIFQKTKELILDPSFQKDTIEAVYFKAYSKQEHIYPKLFVRFDLDGDGQYDCMYESSYYKTADVSTEEARKQVDGYNTWSFWENDAK